MSLLFQPIETRKKQPLDLHDLLVRDKQATFYVRVKGNEFSEFGVFENDVLVVDKSRIGDVHSLYVVISDGDFALASREQVLSESFELWGAVTYVIHKT